MNGGESSGPVGLGAADVAVLLADLVPRLRVDREVIWADGRGLDAERLAERLVERMAELGIAARGGVAAVPVVAELAARLGARTGGGDAATPFLVKERTGWGWRRTLHPASIGSPTPPSPSPPTSGGEGGGGVPAVVVEKGNERAWLAGVPVEALGPSDRLRPLLDGVGVHTLGELAALEREAVEVRLGGAAVDLWRRARADDRRLLFDRIPPERPHGSIDFVDYVLTDPSRLLFTANSLVGPLCDRLTGRGEHARAFRLTLPLANGQSWTKVIRPARPTASRETWLRLIRGLLDRLTVPDTVAGMRIEVMATEEATVRQGDLFDRGFATATAVEAAVARLAEQQIHPLVPESDAHPLVERRGRWSVSRPGEVGREVPPSGEVENGAARSGGGVGQGVGLQLLAEPRRVAVETVVRRDHEVPIRIRERGVWRGLAMAAGPDRISGGQWEASSYAREYYRCVTDEGVPLWIFRNALDGGWFLHGWWD